ncbi:MAG: hypothetical protein ACK41E_11540 [Deinococcales bacterium]
MPVLEHSVSEFIEQHKAYAVRVQIYPQTEASPLLEIKLAGKIVYVFDRVGPYVANTGKALMIVNPMVQTLAQTQTREQELHTVGVSRLEGIGQILAVLPHHVVLEASARLVIGVLDESWRKLKAGDWVAFSSLEPVHGFFVRKG